MPTLLDVAVSAGVYSLAGVLLGGGITWGTQWRLAARTDRLDNRVAKRQVRAELRRIRQTPGFLEKKPERHGFVALDWDKTPEWVAHRDLLARQLSDKSWDAVYGAYEEFGRLRFILREGAEDSEIRDAAERTLARINNALTHLD